MGISVTFIHQGKQLYCSRWKATITVDQVSKECEKMASCLESSNANG